MDVEVKYFDESAIMPKKSTELSAGIDLFVIDEVILIPNIPTRIRTGIGLSIPEGYYGKIFERSSSALLGLCVLGGVIDADYRGEIIIICCNISSDAITISKYTRIAQIIIMPIPNITLTKVDEFTKKINYIHTGFGSTGTK